MDRRGFIKGILTSVAGATAMVTLASAEETKFLSTSAPVALGNVAPEFNIPYMDWSPEVYMRNRGVFLCIGMLTQLQISQGVTDIISWDGHGVLMPGLKRGEFDFTGRH